MEEEHPVDDVTATDTWRLFRIMAEFTEGFEELVRIPAGVSIFGSTHTHPDHPDYAKARRVAYLLAREGYSIITGGGPGIMEAANRGASDAGGVSVGLNIDLPEEQATNKYVTHSITFRYFFVRKVMFVKYACAFLTFPGGYGTLSEFLEALELMQTHKIRPFPLILVGSTFWNGLQAWFTQTLLPEKKIAPNHLNLFQIIDDPDAIVAAVKNSHPLP